MTDDGSRFIVTTDLRQINRESAVSFLKAGVPWGQWRTEEQIAIQIEGAWRVVGVIDSQSGQLVAFCRAVSDGVSLAYLADVYVLPEFQGLGLSRLMLEEMIENGPGRVFRWMLHTDDAHGLYAKFGFANPTEKYLERSIPPD